MKARNLSHSYFSSGLILLGIILLAFSCGKGEVGILGAKTNLHATSPAFSNYNPFAPTRDAPQLTEQSLYAYPGLEVDNLKLVVVDAEHNPVSDTSKLVSVQSVSMHSSSFSISLKKARQSFLLMYLLYPRGFIHPVRIDAGKAFRSQESFLFFSSSSYPGVVAIGVVPLNGALEDELPLGEVAVVSFAEGPAKSVSLAPSHPSNSVDDLSASIRQDGSVVLSWREMHPGDYNNDGEANISDIFPLADLFFQRIATSQNPARVDLVDGNRDGKIDIGDIFPLADNFFTRISGYSVYRTLLSSPDEDPDPADLPRWERLLREGAEPPDAPPSVLRQFNDQDFRLLYTMVDRPTAPGYYAYFVRPFSRLQDSPNEGAISIVAKTTQPAGQAELFLSVANGEGRGEPPIFSVGEDVILEVGIRSAYSVFSANVRFLYNGQILQLIEDPGGEPSPSMPGEEPNLLFDEDFGGDPLFLGLDVGDASADGYTGFRWAAMNATKRKPALTASGSGALGYFRFRVIAGGDEPVTTFEDAFRFPQSTVFIYLMGEQYGSFLPAPSYSDVEAIAVSTL